MTPQYLKFFLCFLLCALLANSCCVYVSENRMLGVVWKSKRQIEDGRKITLNSEGAHVHSPSPSLIVEDIYETKHCYIIKATSYMNGNHEAYLLYSIRDDNSLRGIRKSIGVSNDSIYNCVIDGRMITPVFGMDSNTAKAKICEGFTNKRDKEEAFRNYLKNNYYPEYYILDSKYNQGNLFTVRNLNGIHLLENGDLVVNTPDRFYIEPYINPDNYHLEYHVYIRKN